MIQGCKTYARCFGNPICNNICSGEVSCLEGLLDGEIFLGGRLAIVLSWLNRRLIKKTTQNENKVYTQHIQRLQRHCHSLSNRNRNFDYQSTVNVTALRSVMSCEGR